jgi:biopolymer transport protein ExbB/TolQ
MVSNQTVEQETPWEFVRLAFEGTLGNVVLILLVLMSVCSVGVAIDRICRYNTARKELMRFRQRIGRTLHTHHFNDLQLAAKNNASPGALVITSGLAAFETARVAGLHVFAFDAAKRAMRIAAIDIDTRMRRGLNQLTAIVVTAFFVGVFGTCYHMMTGFNGCNGSRQDCEAAMDYEYARALAPSALGLLLSISTSWAYRYLETKVDFLRLEADAASNELLNYLSLRLGKNFSELSAT